MARRQTYRGDPEEKQVILFDNFSGGINTTTIDEQMTTNAFRNLENVELIEQGRIQKRKGFQYQTDIYEIIPRSYTDPWISGTETIHYMSVVNDERNNFNEFNKSKFMSNKIPFNFTVEIIMSAEIAPGNKETIISSMSFGSKITDDKYKIEYERENLWTINYEDGGKKLLKKTKLTGLNVMNYGGRKFFFANELFENDDSIIEFGYDEETGEFEYINLNKRNSYSPNPYELTNVGFNMFADNPVGKVSSISSSNEAISTVLLFDKDDDKTVLDRLPNNGEFIIRVYYTGPPELQNQLKVKFYVEAVTEETGKEYLQADVKLLPRQDELGYFEYRVSMTSTTKKEVFIELKKEEDLDVSGIITHKFKTTEELLTHYLNYREVGSKMTPKSYVEKEGEGIFSIYTKKEDTKYEYEIKKGKIANKEYIAKNLPRGLVRYNQWDEHEYHIQDTHGIFERFNKQGGFPVLNQRQNQFVQFENHPPIISWTSGSPSTGYKINEGYFPSEMVTVENVTIERNYWNIEPYHKNIVNSSFLDQVGEDSSDDRYYMRYNGGLTGTMDDFSKVELEDTAVLINHTQSYFVGENNTEQIKSLDFTKTKGIIIKDRLVVYDENTVSFSDIYSRQKDSLGEEQGFSYFPNYNWFALPLASGDTIQKISYYRNSYMIFTKNSIYRMSGDFQDENFTIVMVSDVIGCVSPDSVRAMNNTLVFMSEDGLYELKQNYYLDGMENVGKVDKNIYGLIPYGENYESIMYNEQYLLFIIDKEQKLNKVIKNYYNIEVGDRQSPYVVDRYKHDPEYIFKEGINMYGTVGAEIYQYGKGYTDFMSDWVTSSREKEYAYEVVIETPYWSLGYPLHEKKFKSTFVKVNSVEILPIYFDLTVDFGSVVSSKEFKVTRNHLGEIEYKIDRRAEFETDEVMVLGKGILGKGHLGDNMYQVHKISPGSKGKTIKYEFRQDDPSEFSLDAISIVYKLGKMRESR